MGLINKLRGEFIDIIQWLDPTNNTMVHRFERYQNEIKNGAILRDRYPYYLNATQSYFTYDINPFRKSSPHKTKASPYINSSYGKLLRFDTIIP